MLLGINIKFVLLDIILAGLIRLLRIFKGEITVSKHKYHLILTGQINAATVH